MTSILFLLGSSRQDGNSEILAREAAKNLPSGVTQTWLKLSDYPLDAFQDFRHEEEVSYEMPMGNAKTLLDATLAADVIVFACPVYWYSLPAPAKLYLDHWSHWMRVPGLEFRAKMKGRYLFLTTSMAGSEKKEAEPLIQSLQLTANYMGMLWGGHVLAHANAAGDVLLQLTALNAAKALFK